MTADRAFWCWDRVWLGCGASKCAARSSTLELYTGPVFSAHLAIAAHLRHVPDVLSGEHGIGLVQRPFMDIAFSPVQLDLMRAIKQAFDPQGIMNPGKVLP